VAEKIRDEKRNFVPVSTVYKGNANLLFVPGKNTIEFDLQKEIYRVAPVA
jgi:hypothetical protein